MSWDWEKLQEKRKKQGQNPPEDGESDNSFPFNDLKLGKLPPLSLKPGFSIIPIFILISLLWLASGIFIVNPGYEAVVLRFGRFDRTVGEGTHYRLPFPIDKHYLEKVDKPRTIELGMPESRLAKATTDQIAQASMLTGDENIVYVHFYVQFSINNAKDFLFSAREPAKVIESIAEAAMREAVGQSDIESIMKHGKADIQSRAMAIMNSVLENYNLGVHLQSVQLGEVFPPAEIKAAFTDVDSARESRVAQEGSARAYRAKIMPVAEGTAKQMVLTAKAYAETVVKRAEGDAARLMVMYEQYQQHPNAVRTKMYLDAMTEILSSDKINKLVLSKNATNLTPILPLSLLENIKVQAELENSGATK